MSLPYAANTTAAAFGWFPGSWEAALALGAKHLGGELPRDGRLRAVPVVHRAPVRALLAAGLPRALVRQFRPAAAALAVVMVQTSLLCLCLYVCALHFR